MTIQNDLPIAICKFLGLDPNNVEELELRAVAGKPIEGHAKVYKRDSDGKMYLTCINQHSEVDDADHECEVAFEIVQIGE